MSGKLEWFIPDAYFPGVDNGTYVSHEAVCVLNTGDEDAHIELTLYFENKEPKSGFYAVCPARRTNHIRMDKIVCSDGSKVERDVPYAMFVRSDVPVYVQYSRCDTTQSELAFMAVPAF